MLQSQVSMMLIFLELVPTELLMNALSEFEFEPEYLKIPWRQCQYQWITYRKWAVGIEWSRDHLNLNHSV